MAVKFRDYYDVLGVPRTATADEVKREYRRLARAHHPDLKPAAERGRAAERFKEINEAYEVLSDPEKRKKYDALGEHWKGGMDFTAAPGSDGRGGRGVQWTTTTAGADDAETFGDFSDFFAAIFGRSGGGAARGRRASFEGGDVEATMPVTVDELIRGGRRRVSLPNGQSVEVEIPRGAREGTVLRVAGKGEPGAGGGPPGDLYLYARLIPHPRYRVAGDDLEVDLPLQPWQAVLGDRVRVDTPDGPVTVNVPPGTQSGRRLRLRGRGLPRGDGSRGDLHAVVRIAVPERPGAAERAAYEALRQASPGRAR
ncbi:MAG: DnaJ domain-containing protein [Candidatus Rokubacteria bacterium]|nr:DnaJ domain-containing protein [Candidatus Rokubacteria bacterium]